MALDGYTDQILPRAARRAELLDADTELRLAYAWRDQRDEAALHRLITAYMRLAISMASKFRRYGAPMNDLIQEASLGLMKAAEKFDPDRGVRFSTYAVWWIKASIQDYVMRNWSMVRTGSTSAQKALFFNMKRVQAKLAREAEALGETLDQHQLREKVAIEIGVSMAEVAMMEGRLAAEQVEYAHDQDRLRHWLADAMASLSAREQHIVAQRRLMDEPRTLESLGVEMGLSKERIRQLEAAAYAKLRRHLESKSPEVLALL
jgi:RNA polymerase sigma-32 factor